jgi:hypothetical protein
VFDFPRLDHRKSKFGLRHRIKLIKLYTVTKSKKMGGANDRADELVR